MQPSLTASVSRRGWWLSSCQVWCGMPPGWRATALRPCCVSRRLCRCFFLGGGG